MEELYESTLTASLEKTENIDDSEANAGKQTIETLMAGERIMEAIDMGHDDLNILAAYAAARVARPGVHIAPPQRNPVYVALGNISAEQYLANVVSKIHAAHLQDALLVLPFEKVEKLMRFLNLWAEREWNIVMTCKILFFLLRIHHNQIVASKSLRLMLDAVRGNLRRALKRQKDELGFNLAAVRYIIRGVNDTANKEFVGGVDVTQDEGEKASRKGGKKRGFTSLS